MTSIKLDESALGPVMITGLPGGWADFKLTPGMSMALPPGVAIEPIRIQDRLHRAIEMLQEIVVNFKTERSEDEGGESILLEFLAWGRDTERKWHLYRHYDAPWDDPDESHRLSGMDHGHADLCDEIEAAYRGWKGQS